MTATVSPPRAIPKNRRTRVYPRIDRGIHQRLAEYSAMKGMPVRDVIEHAIVELLDGTSDGAKVIGRLDRLEKGREADQQVTRRELAELRRSVDVLSEAFGMFLRYWLVAAWPPPALANEAARAKKMADGAAEYEAFVRRVAERLDKGHRLVNDLPDVAKPPPTAKR